MSPKTRALTGVSIMSVLLVLYFFLAGTRAFAMFSTGDPVAIAMGVALIVLPLVGVWALVRELLFGLRSGTLGRRLAEAGRLPEEEVDTLPSGRPVRDQADEFFPKYKAETEADPENWESWMRLGLVYDACGDRRRARQAINQAIALSR